MPHDRIQILDGWRALSILLVLAGHLLPVGPSAWALNGAVASTGMAIFFTLSGFLITSFLLRKPEAGPFLSRRLFRIVPLAWAAIAVLAIATRADATTIAANLFFVANLPPQALLVGGDHLWSLCLEAQFYVAVAALVAVAGRRALYALPILCVAVTGWRIFVGEPLSIVTWERVDEILAGATLALIYVEPRFKPVLDRIPRLATLLFLGLLVASAHGASGPLNYLRPYIAAAAVGTSLYAAPALMRALFTSRPAAYVAEVSYALYVVHGMLMATWLGSGETLEKYLKRPLFLLATFLIAHLSTFHFERPMIALGKRLEGRRSVKRLVPTPSASDA